jgi:UDP-glucose 4-epimerase
VYGVPKSVPVCEKAPVGNTLNPYAESKLIVENLLKSYGMHHEEFQFVILRYFNPVGAHPSGLLGEKPKGNLNNLMPHIGRVATGQEPLLKVFGDDYPTPDGTGIRDYIHVMDLSKGHVSALDYLNSIDTACSILELESVTVFWIWLEILRQLLGNQSHWALFQDVKAMSQVALLV